jgi:putative GTP pyrophosphokinase
MKKLPGRRNLEQALVSYQNQRPLYVEYALKLSDLLRELLVQEAVMCQAIEQRAKGIDSLREKLRRPGKAYQNGIAEITDLCGLRIITYSLDDVRRVCDLVQHEFEVIPEHTVDKGAMLGPAEFGYRSRHFVVELSTGRSSLAEWKRFSKLRAEIQVRTVLEHAWSAIDHSLRYKREADVPREQKRALFQLSALLELADDSFDRLRQQQSALREDAQKRISNSDDKTLELNSLSYSAYSTSSEILKELTDLAYNAGFQPPEVGDLDLGEGSHIVSDLITIAQSQGIQTIHELDRALQEEKGQALAYFKDLIAQSSTVWETGSAFVAVLCLVRRDKSITKERLVAAGFHHGIAELVLTVASRHRSNRSNR